MSGDTAAVDRGLALPRGCESSRDALRTIIEAAEAGHEEAKQAIAAYEQSRDVEAFKRFFDRFTRTGDDIADPQVVLPDDTRCSPV